MTALSARIVGTGLRFPEGPTYLGDGRVAVVEMQDEAVSVVDTERGTSAVLGDCGGGPNGSTPGASGELYVANNGGLSMAQGGYWHAPRQFDGCVQRIEPSGEVTVVSPALPGPAPHRPNDLCFGPDGALLVTDSANWEDMRNIRPGRVLALDAGGTVRQLLELPGMPNGIAFGPDDDRVFLAQSLTRKILVLDYADGTLGESRTFCVLPSGMPDGFCLDGAGKLYVCASVGNAVFIYGPDGTLLDTLETGEGSQPTNCCIGDGTLYVTYAVAGQLVAFDLGASALGLHTGSVTHRTSEVAPS